MWEGIKVQVRALESVMIGGAKRIRQGPVLRVLEVTWGWIHYSVVEIRQSLNGSYYAGASVFKEAFCAGVECQAS